jgi:23S rRNA pseudouridine2605 synthase
MIRLQKYLADAGVASRRAAEKLIAEGRVSVNGEVIREMGVQVDENYDVVALDGETVKHAVKKEYIMLNKPTGFITTVSDDKGRPTVMELVSDIQARIYPVGRLDYDTEGLLLLTNDGDLTFRITHPKHDIAKTYVAEVTGDVSMDTINQLRRGVVIDGQKTSPAEVEVIGATQYGTKVEITIHEGRNRQVRKMFEAIGCIVKRLKRTKEAGLTLGHLPLGKWRKLSESEVNMLKKIESAGSGTKRINNNAKKTIKAHSRNSNRKNNARNR